jgi:hypothetical protein
MYYVCKKRFKEVYDAVPHIAEHRFMLSDKKSGSIGHTRKEAANHMHILEETNKKRLNFLHKTGPTLRAQAAQYIAGNSARFQILTTFVLNRTHIVHGLRPSLPDPVKVVKLVR